MKDNNYTMSQNPYESFINSHQNWDYVRANPTRTFSFLNLVIEEDNKTQFMQNEDLNFVGLPNLEREHDSMEERFNQYFIEKESQNLNVNLPAQRDYSFNNEYQIIQPNDSLNFSNFNIIPLSQGYFNNRNKDERKVNNTENNATQEYPTPKPEDEKTPEPIKPKMPPFKIEKIKKKEKKKGRPQKWLHKPNGNRSDNVKRTAKRTFINNLEEFVLKKFIKNKTRSGKLIQNLKKINNKRWIGVKNATNKKFFESKVKDLYYITNTRNKEYNAIWKKYHKVKDDFNKKTLDRIFAEKKETQVIEIMHKNVGEVYEIYLGTKKDKDGFYKGFETLEEEIKKKKSRKYSLESFYRYSYEIYEGNKRTKKLNNEDSEEESIKNFAE